jgi:hypothetical protein
MIIRLIIIALTIKILVPTGVQIINIITILITTI